MKHINQEQLKLIKKNLFEKKSKLLQLEEAHEQEVKDLEDLASGRIMATDLSAETMDRDLDLNLAERELEEIAQINEALKRIADGAYGVCEDCEEPIPAKRLILVPEARYCIACETALEAERKTRHKASYELDFDKPIVRDPQ